MRATSADEDAVQALADFGLFPTWMWRNAEVLDFIGWLRTHNDTQPLDKRAGFYGLDLYSRRASMQAVLAYLDNVDPEAARRARRRLRVFRSIRRGNAGVRLLCERRLPSFVRT